jgi:hypothetical protein
MPYLQSSFQPDPVKILWPGFELNGMFSVRSAYRLGLQPFIENLSTGQSSAAPDGDRELWNIIWKANVP